ncbi:hypothetical protein ACFL5L_03595 [candidate division KSB1 bacterium]
MKKVTCVALGLLLIACSGIMEMFNKDENKALIGTWDVVLIEQGMTMLLVFEKEGDILTGNMSFEMGDGVMTDITFKDNQLNFNVALDGGGMTFNIAAEGIVDGEKISGTFFSDMGDAGFSGEKRK